MSFLDELKRRHVVRVALLYVVAAWLVLQMSMLAAPVPVAASERAALRAEAALVLPFDTVSLCGMGGEDAPAPRCPWCMAAGTALAPGAPAGWARLGLPAPFVHRPVPGASAGLSFHLGFSSRAPPLGVLTA